MRRPTLPLSVQLLLTFVGLLAGVTVALTALADSSLRDAIDEDARSSVAAATLAREQALTQLFELRQQRAQGFLSSLPRFCSDVRSTGSLVWIPDCVGPLVDDFRRSAGATGAVLSSGRGVLRRSGRRVSPGDPAPGSLALAVRGEDRTITYLMKAATKELTLRLEFDDSDVAGLFSDRTPTGRRPDVALLDAQGLPLAPGEPSTRSTLVARSPQFVERCREGVESAIDPSDQYPQHIVSVRPVRSLGSACVTARIDYAAAMTPATRLRRSLIARGAWFTVIGIVVSLVASQWIARPVRRLAMSARNLKSGRFDRPIPLAGPSEVRALGRAYNAMANDLAEMVAKEQAARRLAEAANRSKDDFLATVSHELRTPLTAILGWAHMLRSDRLPPDQVPHAIAVIERAARTQRQLIEDLLDVSRIVSNRLQIAREAVRIADVVDAALDTVRPEILEHRISLVVDLDSSLFVLGDARRLEQVVWNLAWNAVKFTQPEGRITVRLMAQNNQAVLAVEDTGVGIEPAFLPHIFEWFRQGEARSRSQAGLGLGLGIVRHIVRLHGGSVRAESGGQRQGATFIVTLPLHTVPANVAAGAVRADPQTTSAERLHHIRVLVVEDDEETRELVRATLESAGATVEVVASAVDARREIDAEKPDLLISDIRMPEEDGYSLIRSLRSAGVVIPAIALSALTRREDADAATAAGFQLHLSKPVDSLRLVQAVASLVDQDTVH